MSVAMADHVGPWTVDQVLALPEDRRTRYELLGETLLFPGAVLHDVGDPQLVGTQPMELAIEQVLGGDDATQSCTRTGPGTPWILACVMSTDAVLEQTQMPMVSSAWTRR